MNSVRPLPACSVVIPCFDAATTIEATIQSACRQTVRDIEIIVVDDGSRDRGPALVAAIAATDARVQLIRQPNGGVSFARNAGITVARSRVVAFLDADDLWAGDHLQTHLRRLHNEPRLGVSYSAARFIDAQGVIIGQSRSKLDNLTPADLLHSNPTTTCSTLVVRREVFKDIGLFRTNMRHNEDQEWLFRVALSGWLMAGDKAGNKAGDTAGVRGKPPAIRDYFIYRSLQAGLLWIYSERLPVGAPQAVNGQTRAWYLHGFFA